MILFMVLFFLSCLVLPAGMEVALSWKAPSSLLQMPLSFPTTQACHVSPPGVRMRLPALWGLPSALLAWRHMD